MIFMNKGKSITGMFIRQSITLRKMEVMTNNEIKTGKNESTKKIKMTCSQDWVPHIKINKLWHTQQPAGN